MNMKPKPGAAHDATKALRARMQGARDPTQRNTQKRKINEKNRKTIIQYYTQQNQDAVRLRTLRSYGRGHRGKAQQTNIEQGDEEESIPSLEKPHRNSISEENRNEAARGEGKETRKETEENNISAAMEVYLEEFRRVPKSTQTTNSRPHPKQKSRIK